MGRYTRNDILAKLNSAVSNINNLYQEEFINYVGKTRDTEEQYTEVIAEFLLKNWHLFKQIKMIRRQSSYNTKSHNGTTRNPSSNRIEERIALSMYGKSFNVIGEILDYQVPLKNSMRDKNVGKIDLLSYNKNDKALRLLELKVPDSKETLLRCILESETYLRIVDKQKLLSDFYISNNNDVQIIASPLIFDGSAQHEEYKKVNPNLMNLIGRFNSQVLLIKEIGSDYQVKRI